MGCFLCLMLGSDTPCDYFIRFSWKIRGASAKQFHLSIHCNALSSPRETLPVPRLGEFWLPELMLL